jgi:hypothetical protein
MADALLAVSRGRGWLLWLMSLLVVAPACDSNSSPGGVGDTDGGMDGAVGDAAPVEPTVRLLVPGEAKLSSCTQGEPAAGAGHHWCAFHRPAPGGEARAELWVVDVSRALAGEPVPCDGSSSSCLRITDRLQGQPWFAGDTLLFRTREATDRDFERFIWAWRSGWSRPRPISPDNGSWCNVSRSGQYGFCHGNSDDMGISDLRAGRVIDQDNSVLPLVERVSYLHGTDLPVAFAGGDELLVYASGQAGGAAQALRVIPLAELGRTPARTVVTDVQRWALSGDGQTVFFLRGSLPGPWGDARWSWSPGSLWAAELSSGGGSTEIASGVLYFRPISRTGVGFFTDPRGRQGTLHIQRDWRHPESRFRMASDVAGWDLISEGRLTAIWQIDDSGERTLVGDNERGTACVVPSRPGTVSVPGFLPSLGAMVWSEPDLADEGTTVTFLARPQDCGDVRVLGKGLQWFLAEVGTRGFVFSTARADDAKVWSLFYVPSYDGRPLDTTGGIILSNDVEPYAVQVVGARREALVMQTTGKGASAKGLYLFGPLPPIPSGPRDLP